MTDPALPTRFDAPAIEKKWREKWRVSGIFTAKADSKKKPYTVIMPPPNVTGSLHLGHAMRNAIEDCLVRWRRMKGDEALFLPGLDHAGIATQLMVTKELAKSGVNRLDLGREKFLERTWAWKAEYGGKILEQFERLGISCDWSRLVFTLDEGPSRAVRHAFKRLHDEGLIYRGEYLINWCPECRTALSDLETDYQEKDGSLWHLTYPFKDGPVDGLAGLTVATTRPETMLGDTAVAVHPDDPRYKKLIGKTLLLPLMNREIPIVADSFVDPKFGTGCVKITPAHDPNDFEAGKRLGLPMINVMSEDAKINENGGEFAGLDRFAARKAIVKKLEAEGRLAKIEKHKNKVGHCDRCKTVVEPRLSTQWFVKMKPLAEKALAAHAKGEFRFTPDHWNKVFTNWLNEIHDWCISRQLWWGHRIPAWFCPDGHITVTEEVTGPGKCAQCGKSELKQDEDVLDTWFSSQLWPLSTLGWPDTDHKDFKKFYGGPATMETGYDILFFWVARMLMAGLWFTRDASRPGWEDGRAPFQEIYLSGLIRDKHGKKMSKTAGNTIDPLEVIDRYGADPLRFFLIIASVGGTDVPFDLTRVAGYRDFATKLWNATRFVMMNTSGDPGPAPSEPKSPVNRWLRGQYLTTAHTVNRALEVYDFHAAADALYHFLWHDFCDWGIELSKSALREPGPAKDEAVATLLSILRGTLKLLHPLMPFLTEEIYAALPGAKKPFLALEDYPDCNDPAPYRALGDKFERLTTLITAIRNLRVTAGVVPGDEIPEIAVAGGDAAFRDFLSASADLWRPLARAAAVRVSAPGAPASGLHGVAAGCDFFLKLDFPALSTEIRAKFENDKAKLLFEIAKLDRQLAAFSEKTPAAVKEKTAQGRDEAKRKLAVVEARLAG